MNYCNGCGKPIGSKREAEENTDGSGLYCPQMGDCNIVDFEGVNRFRREFIAEKARRGLHE